LPSPIAVLLLLGSEENEKGERYGPDASGFPTPIAPKRMPHQHPMIQCAQVPSRSSSMGIWERLGVGLLPRGNKTGGVLCPRPLLDFQWAHQCDRRLLLCTQRTGAGHSWSTLRRRRGSCGALWMLRRS